MDIKFVENRVRMRKLRLFEVEMKVCCRFEIVSKGQSQGLTFDYHDVNNRSSRLE